jgi:glucosamine--fructose-6-phosphate aminotransferase (isomerizing)
MEGALKLKEISYIHAEAYAAGELKHGPLALVDADDAGGGRRPQRRTAREAQVEPAGGAGTRRRAAIVFADAGHPHRGERRRARDPHGRPRRLLSPILHVVPLQLLSYHAALARGTDVDKPRNLAKSVTVE